jgi:hypothetical protein
MRLLLPDARDEDRQTYLYVLMHAVLSTDHDSYRAAKQQAKRGTLPLTLVVADLRGSVRIRSTITSMVFFEDRGPPT